MKSQVFETLPSSTIQALKKLGTDIKHARRRRRISTALMAQKAMISRSTLFRLERGSPEVSIGIYAAILFILDLEQRLADLADRHTDKIGHDLEEEYLPKRLRSLKYTEK